MTRGYLSIVCPDAHVLKMAQKGNLWPSTHPENQLTSRNLIHNVQNNVIANFSIRLHHSRIIFHFCIEHAKAWWNQDFNSTSTQTLKTDIAHLTRTQSKPQHLGIDTQTCRAYALFEHQQITTCPALPKREFRQLTER